METDRWKTTGAERASLSVLIKPANSCSKERRALIFFSVRGCYLPEVGHSGRQGTLGGDVGRAPGIVVHLEDKQTSLMDT